jgi:hypothetical protein
MKLAALIVLLMAAAPARAERIKGTCMLVARTTDLVNGFDQAIYDRLVRLGYTVTIVDDSVFDTSVAATLDTFALCVVSESVASNSIDEILGADVPLMHNESFGWDNAGYAGPPDSSGVIFPADSNSMDVQAIAHPILTRAGVSAGPMALYNQLTNFTNTGISMYGKEVSNFGGGVQILATGSGDQSPLAVVWVYDQGAPMFSGVAANRIVGLCLPGDDAGQNIPAADVTNEYWAIFDASIQWLDPTRISIAASQDTYVSNDTGEGPETNHGGGTGLHARDTADPRRRVALVRFDTQGALDQDISEATLNLFSIVNGVNGAGRTMAIYGVLEGVDDIEENAVVWLDAPGVDNGAALGAQIQLDPSDLTSLLTTYITPASGAWGSSTPSSNFDDFINDDTDGILTFLIAPPADSNGILAASKDFSGGSAPPLLRGFFGVSSGPAPPAVPAGLTATGGAATVYLNWTKNSASNIVGYHVYRDTFPTGPFAERLTPFAINRTTFIDFDVEQTVTYFYKVTAINTFLLESAKSAAASATAAHAPVPSADSHWPLDDGAGLVATDTSANANHGALTNFDGSDFWVTGGAVGGALRMDGIDDYVVMPHDPAYDFADEPFTISFWLKQNDNHPYGPANNENRWLMKGSIAEGPSGTNGRWIGLFNKNRAARFSVDDNILKSEIQVDSTPFVTGNWVHVVAVRDTAADRLRLYANGLSQPSLGPGNVAINGTDRSGAINTTQSLAVGRHPPEDDTSFPTTGHFQGEFDDLRIYRRVLTQAEIDELSLLGPAMPTPTPTPVPTPWSSGQAPGAPNGVQAVGGADTIRVTWTPNPETNVFGYYVYRDTSTTGTFAQRLNFTPLAGAEFVDAGVTAGIEYFYKVGAINTAALEGDLSAADSATAGSVALTMPDYYGEPGTVVSLQINCANATGIAGDGMSFSVSYNPAVLSPVGALKTALTQNVTIDSVTSGGGQVDITCSAPGSVVIVGEGHLLNVRFLVSATADLDTIATHTFVAATLFDASHSPLAVDIGDDAVMFVSGEYNPGDPDGDGSITQNDALVTQQAVLGQIALNALETGAADMNGDGVIDSADLVLLLRASSGLPINPAGLGGIGAGKGSGLAGTPDRTVSVGSLAVDPQQEFLIPVVIDPGTGVAGVDMKVAFDPTIVQLLDVLPGNATVGFLLGSSVSTGQATISLARSSALGSGPRQVALLRFVATGNRGKSTPLLLLSCKLSGEYGQNLAWSETIATLDGEVEIEQIHTGIADWTIYR